MENHEESSYTGLITTNVTLKPLEINSYITGGTRVKSSGYAQEFTHVEDDDDIPCYEFVMERTGDWMTAARYQHELPGLARKDIFTSSIRDTMMWVLEQRVEAPFRFSILCDHYYTPAILSPISEAVEPTQNTTPTIITAKITPVHFGSDTNLHPEGTVLYRRRASCEPFKNYHIELNIDILF